jgi:hypothetical protein
MPPFFLSLEPFPDNDDGFLSRTNFNYVGGFSEVISRAVSSQFYHSKIVVEKSIGLNCKICLFL